MRILIDIGHPAHVHYFKNLYRILKDKGHELCITSRDKEITFELLNHYQIPFIKRGKGGNNILTKILYILKADAIILNAALKFEPDILLGFSSFYASHVAALLGKPFIALTDTEQATEQHMLFMPFSKYVLTPNCYLNDFGKKQIRFDSYMELCYLHPKYFKPEPDILERLGLKEGEKYSIVRFVKWAASHDIGHKGLTTEHKVHVVKTLSEHGKVFVSAEGGLPTELTKFKYPLPPSTMHSALYHATLLYGESATMASECAMLGTYSIFHNKNRLGYTYEQEQQYGLVYNFDESSASYEKALNKAVEILKNPTSKANAIKASEKLISEKIDPTNFFCWFIENYPQSAFEMKKDPSVQYKII